MQLYQVIIVLFFSIPTIAQSNGYDNLPPEKRLQICLELCDALNPAHKQHSPRWWQTGKLVAAGIAGISTAYAATLLDSPQELVNHLHHQDQTFFNLKSSLSAMRKDLSTEQHQPTETVPTPHQPAGVSPGHIFTFAATSAAGYFLLSLLFDKKVNSYNATLKTFLTHWPDYAMHAPKQLAEQARPIYAANLHHSATTIPDEKTAKLIVLAFTLALTDEINAITQTLS